MIGNSNSRRHSSSNNSPRQRRAGSQGLANKHILGGPLSLYLFLYLSISLSLYLSIYLSIYPSIYLSSPRQRRSGSQGPGVSRDQPVFRSSGQGEYVVKRYLSNVFSKAANSVANHGDL